MSGTPIEHIPPNKVIRVGLGMGEVFRSCACMCLGLKAHVCNLVCAPEGALPGGASPAPPPVRSLSPLRCVCPVKTVVSVASVTIIGSLVSNYPCY